MRRTGHASQTHAQMKPGASAGLCLSELFFVERVQREGASSSSHTTRINPVVPPSPTPRPPVDQPLFYLSLPLVPSTLAPFDAFRLCCVDSTSHSSRWFSPHSPFGLTPAPSRFPSTHFPHLVLPHHESLGRRGHGHKVTILSFDAVSPRPHHSFPSLSFNSPREILVCVKER